MDEGQLTAVRATCHTPVAGSQHDELWKTKPDWDFDVAEDGFREPHSPSGGIHVYGVSPAKVLAFGKSPYSQTRYRFADAGADETQAAN